MVVSRNSRIGGSFSRATTLVMRSQRIRIGREAGICSAGLAPIQHTQIISHPKAPMVEKTITINPTLYVRRVIKLAEDCDAAGRKLIYKAFRFAWQAHGNQMRDDGVTPHIEHCLAPAEIVRLWGRETEARAAALLHDTLEDTETAEDDLVAQFGKLVADMVKGATKLKTDSLMWDEQDKRKASFASIKRWLEFGKKPELIDVVFIKLADRLNNARTFRNLSEAKVARIARETLFVYAVIARALGIWQVRRELEDLSFPYVDPEAYRAIEKKRGEIVAAYGAKAEEIAQEIKSDLVAHFKEEVSTSAEIRCVYELYQRMQKWGITLDELTATDVFRMSVVLSEEADCYSAMGRIHKHYPRVKATQENFMYWYEDMIGEPDLTGHQMLHVYVKKVPHFRILLVQIRDAAMWRAYHHGVLVQENWKASTQFLGALFAALEEEGVDGSDLDKMHAVVGDYALQMRAFTPKGDARMLPQGAKVLDFARLIHEQVFLHAAGAKINNRPAALGSRVHEGDTVEVMTDKKVSPSLDWLEQVRMPLARKQIREYLRKRPADESAAEGLSAMGKESQKYHFTPGELFALKVGEKYLAEVRSNSMDDLVLQVGRGEKKAADVLQRIIEIYEEEKGRKYAANKTLETYYVEIGPMAGRHGIRIIRQLLDLLDDAGYSIASSFHISRPEKGKIIMKLGVEVLGGADNGGMAGQVQRMQIENIAKKVGEE